jgi:ABC-type transport system involved in multi-copper enzyme maturation permease subunit
VFGAIFLQEMLVAGRRQRSYFLRWVYAAVLLVQLAPRLLASLVAEWRRPGSSALGLYAQFFDSFTAQHFFYLLVLTPALAAGAITDEKTRGTLDHLLTTCLHPAEIVLGKMFSRFCQVLAVALVALPIVGFFGVIADLDILFAAGLFAASAVLILGVTALSVLASVWCRRTRDAVLCSYLVLIAGFGLVRAAAAAGWTAPAEYLSPWYAIARDGDGRLTVRLVRFALAWLVPTLGCVLLACWRMRPATEKMRQGTRPGWAGRRLAPMGADENPVVWRERCVQGIAPLARLRAIPTWLAVPAVALASAAALIVPVLVLLDGRVNPIAVLDQEGLTGLHLALALNGVNSWAVASPHAGIALAVFFLLVTVRASGAITDERERGSWDQLLLTPMTTREIVRGKFWGVLRAAVPYLAAYAVPALPLALLIGGEAFAVCFFAVGTMLLGAPWLAALGLFCSANLSSSWRSLLATIAAGYAYLLVTSQLTVVAIFAFCIVKLVFMIIGPLVREGLPGLDSMASWLAASVTLLLTHAAILVVFTWGLLLWTESRVEKAERARVTRIEREQKRLALKLTKLAEELAEEDGHRA